MKYLLYFRKNIKNNTLFSFNMGIYVEINYVLWYNYNNILNSLQKEIIIMSKIEISESKKLNLPKITISQPDLDLFDKALETYISNVSKAIENNENEEHIKNIINDFLRMNFYKDSRFTINTDGNIDSTIKENGNLLAIIENKAPQNKNEMINEDNINKKALWEAMYYYMDRALDVSKSTAMISTTSEIRRIIITDGINWFLFDAGDFHNIINGDIKQRYYKYKNDKLAYNNDRGTFYQELRQRFDEINITEKLPYIYFDISQCSKKKTTLVNLYKILSEQYLIKNSFNINYESHSLNSGFYHELLYIMGLKETVKNNKLIVEIDHDIKNSLSDQVYNLLKEKEIDENKINELTFELVLIWINRLLFIKLFEGQLILFNSDIPDYHIISHDKIKDFNDFQNLFLMY